MFNLNKIAYELNKYAKVPNWFPEDIKNHPDILQTPDEVEKDLLDLKPFRKKIFLEPKIENQNIETFALAIKAQLLKIYENEIVKILLDKDLSKLLINNSFDENIKTKDGQLNKNQKITNIYSNLQKKYNNLKPLEQLNGFKEYSKEIRKPMEATIVFSTDPNDILLMSSRSTWQSCQDIFGSSIIRGSSIGTALMKNVGIIYLTNEKDFKNRGEEMLFRSLVRIVKGRKSSSRINFILLDSMYPNKNLKIENEFIKALSENTKYDVVNYDSLEDYSELYIDADNYQSKLESSYYDSSKIQLADIDKENELEVLENFVSKNYYEIINNENYAKWVLFKILTLNILESYNFNSLINKIHEKFKHNTEITEAVLKYKKNILEYK